MMDYGRMDGHSAYETGQNIRDRTFLFACRVLTFCHGLYEKEGVSRLVVGQLIACSSSTSTMLEEAKAAESDADFISKCCISLKECRESWTRLRISGKCGLADPREAKALVQESHELVAIITTIIRNTRSRVKRQTKKSSARRF
jgi:four helix bundle protein